MSSDTWHTGFTHWIVQQVRENGIVEQEIPEALLWCWTSAARSTGLDPEDVREIARRTGAAESDVLAACGRDNAQWAAEQDRFDQPDLVALDKYLDTILGGLFPSS
ncbi:hypothetical protein [Streptacidiphilus fuscans]|uniref:Uncharacterized protein n=1 Tax=Streptacidiphilus fuscans TaxID=2789292 RepID=A0A931B3A6_9ACTN|nr:hypothetical protein [Streptacidiphilus fuscans]MBF9069508.1 hypothetical protein [Streptacidiphilus fuscans]